jgi:hypothetical protein
MNVGYEGVHRELGSPPSVGRGTLGTQGKHNFPSRVWRGSIPGHGKPDPKTFQVALLSLLLVVMFLRFSWLKFIHIP